MTGIWQSWQMLSIKLLFLATCLHAGYLTKSEIQTIKKHLPDYIYAAKRTGVPVAILPAIQWRESGLENVKNIGGPFMLDCGGAGEEFIKRIRAYERAVYRLYGGRGTPPRVSKNFRFAVLVAAHHLKEKDRGKGVADMVWGYNGRATWVLMAESSYLWNDPKKHRLVSWFKNHKTELIQYVDERPGVMVIYREIKIAM